MYLAFMEGTTSLRASQQSEEELFSTTGKSLALSKSILIFYNNKFNYNWKKKIKWKELLYKIVNYYKRNYTLQGV